MQHPLVIKHKLRIDCPICQYRVDPNNDAVFFNFRCRIRALMQESFKVWRCPDCQSIHCLDVVDLDTYYAKYPFGEAQLVWPLRIIYGNLLKQLTKHGFSRHHRFLDYGCGTHGLFLQYLTEKNFSKVAGYDPYAPETNFGNSAILKQQFDYVSTQDVIEHVEDPDAFLSEINRLVVPGGYVLVGTPNAASIALNRPDVADYEYAVHVPYHLHIYTRNSLEQLGKHQGWQVVDYFDRKYDDTLWPCLNNRAVNSYMEIFDGSMDVLAEPLRLGKAFSQIQFLFWSIFGYWFSLRINMGIMFRKSH